MANQELELDGIKVSAEDAIAFLESLHASKLCPVCANNVWHVNLSPSPGEFMAFGTYGGPAPHLMAVYSTNCSRCGYVRVHSLGVLRAWKEAQAQKDGGNDEP
jgi:hypothetical protein